MTVRPFGIGNPDQLTGIVANSLPIEQFIRELLYNSIQAVQRAGGGQAHIDYVEIDLVTKLRFWDTGDGMGRTEMLHRLGDLAVQDRTGENFGVGAKVSLRNVSPHGAVFLSVRDGVAHELVLADEGTGFGVRQFIEHPDPVEATTRRIDLSDDRIPAQIRKTGNGTVVVVMGRSADDSTAHTLRGDSDKTDWWLATSVNNRFTRFPTGVNVHVAGYQNKPGGKHLSRPVRGSATHADHYITTSGSGEDRNVDLHGAKGKVRLEKTIPATAYWWVLPNKQLLNGKLVKKDRTGYYRTGGRVRVCTEHETYLESARAFRAAGIWTNQGRIQIHVVPDADVTCAPDPGRTSLTIDGVRDHEALENWMAELAGKHPKAIRDLMQAQAAPRKGGDKSGALMESFYSQLMHFKVRSNRGNTPARSLGPDAQALAGNSLPHCAGSRGTDRGSSGPSRNLFGRVKKTLRPRAAGTAQRVGADPAGQFRARTSGAPVTAPQVRWVNTGAHDISDEFTDRQAGGYEPVSNTLVLNAQFVMISRLEQLYVDKVTTRGFAGAEQKVIGYVRDTFEEHMRDAVTGALALNAGDRDELSRMLTDEALTTVGANLGEVSKRLNVTMGSKFTSGIHAVAAAS